MNKSIFLHKGIKGILALWFLLCILPGDCLLLGCGEQDANRCAGEETAIASHHDADDCTPPDDDHCTDCCVLCAHNLVVHVCQTPSHVFIHSSIRARMFLAPHADTIFQTVIYHPPRLTA